MKQSKKFNACKITKNGEINCLHKHCLPKSYNFFSSFVLFYFKAVIFLWRPLSGYTKIIQKKKQNTKISRTIKKCN